MGVFGLGFGGLGFWGVVVLGNAKIPKASTVFLCLGVEGGQGWRVYGAKGTRRPPAKKHTGAPHLQGLGFRV